jgi:HemY protein
MVRSLIFIAKLAVLVAAAVWLAYQPSRVSIEIFGYQIDTSVGILILAVFLITLASVLIHRYWRLLAGAPGSIGRVFRENRRRRGYKALTQGMVAVAAGDPDEARRWARKAEVLMDEPPLTLLLSAQAAQLAGDDQAARRYFEAMLEREETRFMGLRGCLMQALRRGDSDAALDYVQQAHDLRPKTPWVLTAMVELSEQAGDLAAAERAVRQAVRHKALPPPEGERKRAVITLERAGAARAAGDGEQALKLAREAHKLAPSLVPATVLLAELRTAAGRRGEAGRILERAWPAQPHPDLARLYRSLQKDADALAQVGRMAKLVAGAPDHPESQLTQAETALDAQLWGEARRHLAKAAGKAPGERVCRLMARLEESEHGDGAKARAWLLRAGRAPRDPAWVCGSCGALAGRWSAHCGACKTFDSVTWRPPVQVGPEARAADGGGKPETELPALEILPRNGNGGGRALTPSKTGATPQTTATGQRS